MRHLIENHNRTDDSDTHSQLDNISLIDLVERMGAAAEDDMPAVAKPERMIDDVIVHELAHFVSPGHAKELIKFFDNALPLRRGIRDGVAQVVRAAE